MNYILIKEYPKSLPLGTTVKKNAFGQYATHDYHIFFDKETIENNPEFWKPIIEKDLKSIIERAIKEVLIRDLSGLCSYFRHAENIEIYNHKELKSILSKAYKKMTGTTPPNDNSAFWFPVKDNNIRVQLLKEALNLLEEKDYEILGYNFTKKYDIERNLTPNGYPIHQVKRLSDGEVFTVGNYIHCFNGGGKIYKFEYNNNTLLIHFVDSRNTYCPEWCTIQNISHPREPIFITEDGVDLYEGDNYWVVDPTENYKCIRCHYYITKRWINADDKQIMYFSTKEKAKEWIQEHKPKYSVTDIAEAFEKCPLAYDGSMYVYDYFWDNLE